MLAVAIMCLPIFFTDNQVSRREGVLLLGYYALYIGYLITNATHPDSIWIGSINLVVIPLTLLMLSLLGWRTWMAFRRKQKEKERAKG